MLPDEGDGSGEGKGCGCSHAIVVAAPSSSEPATSKIVMLVASLVSYARVGGPGA